MKTDKISITPFTRRCQGPEWAKECSERAKEIHARRRAKFEKQYGDQSVGAYQTAANPTPSFRDWKVDPRSLQVVAHTDWMQPEFLLHRYGGSFVLRESNLMAGGKSLAQDCSIPVRDANGFLVEQEPLEEAA